MADPDAKDVFSMFDNTPDTLFDQSMNVFVKNIYRLTKLDPNNHWRKLNDDVALPRELCEAFLLRYQKSHHLDNNIVNLFRDRNTTRLKTIRIHISSITDEGLRLLMEHKPEELELNHCDKLTQISLDTINNNSENLRSLKFGPATFVLPQDEKLFCSRGFVIDAPILSHLTIQRRGLAIFPMLLLKPLASLVHLDLTECTSAGSIWALSEMKKLQSLVLHSVHWSKDIIEWIVRIPSLKHLDLSQCNERHGKYYNPNNVLHKLVTSLTKLESLDISGTNLAGTGASVVIPMDLPNENPAIACRNEVKAFCDIPGLVSRIDNPLEFLGLYGTQHGACKRLDIPAKKITGDANEEQIILASHTYMNRPVMLSRVLNDLYYLFRYENNGYVGQALAIVLEAMEKHPTEKHIQISGSATLFYIVKGREKDSIHIKLKKKIISALLDGMDAHIADDTMMRNGCLTLCQFKIPQDVLFAYERVVLILLSGVSDVTQEGFVQRIAIYLLNSLACQVDGSQKQFLGNHGAIARMLNLIDDRVERQLCDDVLEVAWSTMWNVTDETPDNCRRFLEDRGMELFLECLKAFHVKDELLRNMMGLLGNVAEVAELRPQLMDKTLLTVFNDLLESTSDGIEVSYNAAGVLAHIASDGPRAWTVDDPNREMVLQRIENAISQWSLQAERNINYRSFEPILRLLTVFHTPQCQHWATWALANLTSVYPEKYCALVESEGGLVLLQQILAHPEPYRVIRDLARIVIANCAEYSQRTPSPELPRASARN